MNPENRVFPEGGFLFHLSWFYCCGSWLYYMNSAVADTCCITYHKKAAMLLVKPPFHQYLLDLDAIPAPRSVACRHSRGSRRCFLEPFSFFSEFQNDGFDFCERDALMTHRVTPLTSQSVTFSLTTSHFSTCLDQLEPSRY